MSCLITPVTAATAAKVCLSDNVRTCSDPTAVPWTIVSSSKTNFPFNDLSSRPALNLPLHPIMNEEFDMDFLDNGTSGANNDTRLEVRTKTRIGKG